VRREWELDDLIDAWTLVDADWELVATKYGASKLGFVLLLKFFEIEGRFPRGADEFPPAAVTYMARQVRVDPDELDAYAFTGRTIEHHRRQIRIALGFREATAGDADKLTIWLAEQVCPSELDVEHQRQALLARCRAERIEPPARSSVDRILGAANRAADQQFCATIVGRLSTAAISELEALVPEPDTGDRGSAQPPAEDEEGGYDSEGEVGEEDLTGFFAELKADPGPAGLETGLAEVAKLRRVQALGLPADLLADVAEQRVAIWRARAANEYPSTLWRDHTRHVRLTLLAVLCSCRQVEITDGLTDLLIQLVHRINTRAEKRVRKAEDAEFRRVANKHGVLYHIAGASLRRPDEPVRTVVFPAVPGGEQTLRDLEAEGKATEAARRARVRTVLTSSYSNYYRRMLPKVLAVLTFRCNNITYRPVMDALALLDRYADRDGRLRHYDPGERVPLDGVARPDWREAVIDERGRVERVGYELCVLDALRNALRRREIWVEGSSRHRNPEADLPVDFDLHRDVHYAAIRQPTDPAAFTDGLRQRLDAALTRLAEAIRTGAAGGVRVTTRRGQVWTRVPRQPKQPEPAGLEALKAEVQRRWGVIDLLDVLKDADWLTGFTDEFTSAATREHVDRDTLRKRLLLDCFALGTNVGIRRIVTAGDHGQTEAQLRRARRLFITRDNLRAAVTRVVNDTLTARDPTWWGEGTACASDAKKFGAWESNLMTEWHNRYKGPGIMIYWHVERKSVCVYSQVRSASSSEVAAMMEGLLRHGTDAEVESVSTDTHGASIVGFAFTHLLGYRLLPRLKNIGSARLYRPYDGAAYPGLDGVLSRPIRWELIAQQYDQMVKYATALRLGTAEAEQVLRRFTRPGPKHPTYQAIEELGRVVRTLFICEYLSSPELRREIHEALQIVEQWNAANLALRYGRDAELPGVDREHVEVSALALHLLQSALVLINTRLLDRVLEEPVWAQRMTEHDRRGLSPLFWSNVALYGRWHLDMDQRIDFDRGPDPDAGEPSGESP
jgi:TnpA family transposase